MLKVKYKILSIGICLWLIAFIQMLSSHAEDTKEPAIAAAFAANKFSDTNSIITATGSYNASSLSKESCEDFLIGLAKKLGITNGLVYDFFTKDNITTASLVRTCENTDTVLKLITTKNTISETETIDKTILSIKIEFEDSLESAFYYKDILKDLLETNNISSDISICLQGIIPGEISLTDKNIIADRLISDAGGTIVTESRNQDIFTIYAYTNSLEDYILCGSMKTNLNLIISYNELTNQTEVSLSTPFYNEDF